MGNKRPIPATTDREFWGDATHATVNTDQLPIPNIDLKDVKRRGPYLLVDNGDSGVAIDWRRFKIADGKLTRR